MNSLLSNPNTLLLLAFGIGFSLANMLSKNLITTLIRVKVLKQGNIVVCVAHNLEDYYVPGNLDAGVLSYKAKKRTDNPDPKRILAIDQDCLNKAVYKTFNCPAILVDDIKNSVYVRKNGAFDSIGGYNAEAMSEKIDTALKKPPEDEVSLMPTKTFQLIMIGGIVVLGIGLYMVYAYLKKHDTNTKAIYDIVSPMYNQVMNTTRV